MPSPADVFHAATFLTTFVTVLVIMDPVGNVPVFLSLSAAMEGPARRRAARQAVTVAGAVILTFALFGQQILHLLSISLEALQVAGGLLLVLIALELLRPEDDASIAEVGRNVALVPLGTPLLAGPGAIAATMLAMRRADTVAEVSSVVLAIVAVLVVAWAALRFSLVISRVLKENGIHLISRVMGVLLAAIAVQLVASGVAGWVEHGVQGATAG
ncbi:MAG TPA: MarC family protein [Egibacteraceae bacterium]|nr:MarC family protein [Egibacteraceae bacterium]